MRPPLQNADPDTPAAVRAQRIRLRERPGRMLRILRCAAVEWDRDNVSRLAAALAYYTVFSLAPLLVIVVAVAGFVFGEEAARGEIVRQIQSLIGREGAEMVEALIRDAARPGAGIVATVLGLLALALGATGTFAQLQGGLNTVWEVAPRSGRVLRSLVRTRILSFAMVLGVGFLLLVSLVVTAALQAFGAYLEARLPELLVPLGVLNAVLSFVIITLLFAMIYRTLPDAVVAWRDVWLGSAITSGLFALGKHVIGLYLGNSSVGSAYGAAGTVVILLLWVYYSAQIFYFGAEIAQVHATEARRPIHPKSYARRVLRVLVPADDTIEARVRAAAEVTERLQEVPTAPTASEGIEEEPPRDGGPRAAASAGSPDVNAPTPPASWALATVGKDVTRSESSTDPVVVPIVGPDRSQLERLAGIVAGLLVGVAVGAMAIKRRFEAARHGEP